MRPRVSILINNYNNGPWLRACVDSALGQKRPADEIIVYDDGSSDDSVAILRSYGDRIRLIEGVHDHSFFARQSQARAIHRAFQASSGQHLYMLDGDDMFSPDKLECYEAAWAEKPEAMLVQAPMIRMNVDGCPLEEVIRSSYVPRNHPQDMLATIYRKQDTDFIYWMSALAFHRRLLERLLPLNLEDGLPDYGVDPRLASLAALYGPVISLRPELTFWRQRPQSISARARPSRLRNVIIRNRYFNAYARRAGFRPIRLWRNPSFYKEAFLALLPRSALSYIRDLRWRLQVLVFRKSNNI